MGKSKAVLAMVLALAVLGSCSRAPLLSPAEVAAVLSDRLPEDPDDPSWEGTPIHRADLLLQDLVEPRLLEYSIPFVEVQAFTDGRELAVRLRWEDASTDGLPGIARFGDACAIQLPSSAGPDVPAPQMGESGKSVQITYWSAFWESSRSDRIEELYPGAAVDHYPFEAPSIPADSRTAKELADLYSPARRLGNNMAGPRERSVEDLVAEGPGTLSRAPNQVSRGRGERWEEGWTVVIRRPLTQPLGAGERTQIAFAVWQGSNQESGARKMRSAWIPLAVVEAGP